MQRLTEYYDGEARAIRIDHKKAFAKLAAYEDTELTPGEVAELKQELIAARSRLVDVEKALELACKAMAEYIEVCQGELEIELPTEVCPEPCCNDPARCWKEYFLWKARGEHE